MSKLRLNLGSNDDARDGFLSVDRVPPADVVADLSEPWPWQDNEVTEIYAKDVAEHIGNGYRLKKVYACTKCAGADFGGDAHGRMHCSICGALAFVSDVSLEPYNGMIHFMNEAWRVLEPGGRLELIVPCYPGIAVWCDPTHAAVYTQDTRFYFDQRWLDPQTGERGRLGPGMGIKAVFRTLPCRSGVDWEPVRYAVTAPDRRKLFLNLEAVK